MGPKMPELQPKMLLQVVGYEILQVLLVLIKHFQNTNANACHVLSQKEHCHRQLSE